MMRVLLVLVLALGLPAGDWWDDDPFACPEPDEPNCGAPNGAGGWPEDPAPAVPAASVAGVPVYTG